MKVEIVVLWKCSLGFAIFLATYLLNQLWCQLASTANNSVWTRDANWCL